MLVEDLDRLSRDQAGTATLYEQLTYDGVQIVTLAEGEINEMHVGMKGAQNTSERKKRANNTRRGLRGRIEAGKSGGNRSAAMIWFAWFVRKVRHVCDGGRRCRRMYLATVD